MTRGVARARMVKRSVPTLGTDARVSLGVNRATGVWNFWVGSEATNVTIEFETDLKTLRAIMRDCRQGMAILSRPESAGKAGGRGRKKGAAE